MSTMDTSVYDPNGNGIVDSAEGIDIQLVTDGPIQQYQCLSINNQSRVYPTDWPTPESCETVIGIALESTNSSGNIIKIRTFGMVVNNAWNFKPGKAVYVSYSGFLTQDVLVRPFSKVGFALATNALWVRISEGVF